MRKHYIDNLRWIAIMLLIPYHAAMAWNIWGEPNYIYLDGSKLISSIVVFFSPYFMPLLFLIAGMSSVYSLKKRTVKQYVYERVRKLLLPLVFATILFMPVMTYFADKFNYHYDGNFLEHYNVFFTKFTDLTGADGGFSIGQFWFILYLFVISIIAIGIISLQKKIIPIHKKDIPFWFVCILGLPLPLLSELLSIGGKSITEYTYIFLVGYYVFSNDCVIDKAEKYKWIFLLVGFIAAMVNVYLFIWSDTQYEVLNIVAKYICEWFMLIALLGLGKEYLNFASRLTAYMNKRSFGFYILHFVWVVVFQYYMADSFADNTALLYIIPVLCSYCTSFLCCEICARIPILRVLMGIKQTEVRES